MSILESKLMKKLKTLYANLDDAGLTIAYEKCNVCPLRCRRETYVHWLLPEEYVFFREMGMDVLEIPTPCNETIKAYFFKGGDCKYISKTGCIIYENRPLECRLNPISIYNSDFVIYKNCPAFIDNSKKTLDNAKIVLPDLREILAPWRKYFMYLTSVISQLQPSIKDEMFVIGNLTD